VDPLGEALHFLRMSGIFYCRSELTAPWALALPVMKDCLSFHVVTSGECWLEVEGADRLILRPGDLALVPHSEGHCLSSDPGIAGHRIENCP
jgi:Cupin